MTLLTLILCAIFSLVTFTAALRFREKTPLLVEAGHIGQTVTVQNSLRHRKKFLESAFMERVCFPAAQRIFEATQHLFPLGNQSWVTQKLIQAGYTKPSYPKVLLGSQLLLCTIIFCLLLFSTVFIFRLGLLPGMLLSLFYTATAYFLPLVWLRQQVKRRQDCIQKALPDFLDLLIICVEAGLGLDTAIIKITEMGLGKNVAPLRQELLRYLKDIQLGKPRKDALIDMAARTGLEDFNILINSLVQAYDLGNSIAHTLRIQSDAMRVKRLQKAEERANQIPVKMVMPIYIFLFPAIFVAIFGPVGMVLINTITKIFSNTPILR